MSAVRADAAAEGVSVFDYLASQATPRQHLEALAAASARLEEDFGSWRTPWGDINRFQRLTGDIVHPFDDDAPSIPVGFTSARWGSLASYGAARRNGSKKLYGTSGNSFVAVVEFGDTLRARAVTAGSATIQTRLTSTTRPSATAPGTSGPCTSIATSSRDTPSASITRVGEGGHGPSPGHSRRGASVGGTRGPLESGQRIPVSKLTSTSVYRPSATVTFCSSATGNGSPDSGTST